MADAKSMIRLSTLSDEPLARRLCSSLWEEDPQGYKGNKKWMMAFDNGEGKAPSKYVIYLNKMSGNSVWLIQHMNTEATIFGATSERGDGPYPPQHGWTPMSDELTADADIVLEVLMKLSQPNTPAAKSGAKRIMVPLGTAGDEMAAKRQRDGDKSWKSSGDGSWSASSSGDKGGWKSSDGGTWSASSSGDKGDYWKSSGGSWGASSSGGDKGGWKSSDDKWSASSGGDKGDYSWKSSDDGKWSASSGGDKGGKSDWKSSGDDKWSASSTSGGDKGDWKSSGDGKWGIPRDAAGRDASMSESEIATALTAHAGGKRGGWFDRFQALATAVMQYMESGDAQSFERCTEMANLWGWRPEGERYNHDVQVATLKHLLQNIHDQYPTIGSSADSSERKDTDTGKGKGKKKGAKGAKGKGKGK